MNMKWKKKPKPTKDLLSEGERVRNALIIAKAMLKKGLSIDDVVKITGLSKKEVKEYVELSFQEISKVKQIQLKLM